jgi:hypothetical protein
LCLKSLQVEKAAFYIKINFENLTLEKSIPLSVGPAGLEQIAVTSGGLKMN